MPTERQYLSVLIFSIGTLFVFLLLVGYGAEAIQAWVFAITTASIVLVLLGFAAGYKILKFLDLKK